MGKKPRSLRIGECTRLAGAQHGALGRAQALNAGLSPSSIRRLAAAGDWRCLHPGVFALWTPATGTGVWHQRLAAATLWLGDSSAVSHRAALLLWELDGVDSAPVELSTTGRRRSTQPGIVIHRVRNFLPDEIVVRLGIRVTSVERTLIDVAAVVAPNTLELAIESALRRRLVTRARMAEKLRASSPTLAGRGILRNLLEGNSTAATESALETRVWRALVERGLAPPIRQHEVQNEAGVLVARVDFAYPEAKIAIEADGYRFHSGRRDWRRDKARHNELTRLGWRVFRITWDDVVSKTPAFGALIRCLSEALALAKTEAVPGVE